MKKGAKITVFIASMALTLGSLIAIAGPRYHRHWGCHSQAYGCGWQQHGACTEHDHAVAADSSAANGVK